MCHNTYTQCEPLSLILHLIYEFLMPRGTHFIFFKLAILYWSIVDWVYFSVLSLLFMHQGYDLLCCTLITRVTIWRLNNGSWGRRTCLRSRLLSQLDFKSEPRRVQPTALLPMHLLKGCDQLWKESRVHLASPLGVLACSHKAGTL